MEKTAIDGNVTALCYALNVYVTLCGGHSVTELVRLNNIANDLMTARYNYGRFVCDPWEKQAEEDNDEDHQERRDAAPDYRTAEQYYADLAHEQKRKHLAGED
jgi:hypothetical protein